MQKKEEKAPLTETNFELCCRVYYEDTDSQGILYHGRCLNFFERARTEWVRALGINQSTWLRRGLGFVVSRAELYYKAPAFFDEEVVSTVNVKQIKRTQILMDQNLIKKDRCHSDQGSTKPVCLVSAQFRIAFVNLQSFRPAAIPNEMLVSLRAAGSSI